MRFRTAWIRGNTVQYSVIGTDGRARRTVDIEVAGSPMMHDFSLTERHVVFYDLPVTFDAGQAAAMAVPRGLRLPARLLLSALIGRVRIPDPIAARMPRGTDSDRRLPYSWNPDYPARVGVMPRDGSNGDVRWFDVEPCYVFHPMNAYDDGDTDRARRRAAPRRCSTPTASVPTKVRRRWTAGLSISPTERCVNRGSTIAGRSFLASTSAGRQAAPVRLCADRRGTARAGDTLIKHDLVGGNTQSALVRSR